jgi:hypothetical protein
MASAGSAVGTPEIKHKTRAVVCSCAVLMLATLHFKQCFCDDVVAFEQNKLPRLR